jgi:hypothetical protein
LLSLPGEASRSLGSELVRRGRGRRVRRGGDVSLDEHLLERVSGLEEIVKRSAETLRSVVDAVQKHERAIFINQTGLLSVKELLEKKHLVSSDELVELWESKMGEQMLALEKKQRFTERKDRMVSLFRGEKRALPQLLPMRRRSAGSTRARREA